MRNKLHELIDELQDDILQPALHAAMDTLHDDAVPRALTRMLRRRRQMTDPPARVDTPSAQSDDG